MKLCETKWRKLRFFYVQDLACSRDGNRCTLQFTSADEEGRSIVQDSPRKENIAGVEETTIRVEDGTWCWSPATAYCVFTKYTSYVG